MTEKIGRNDPCPCGSGKKYKRCCLGKKDVVNKQKSGIPLGRLSIMNYGKELKGNPELLKALSSEADKVKLDKSFTKFIENLWDNKKMSGLTTKEIVERLKDMNVCFEANLFKKQAGQHISAIRLAEEHYYTQDYKAQGHEEDFIWLAICELWKRLLPGRFNIEILDELMQEGYRDIDSPQKHKEGVGKWLRAWAIIKEIVPSRIASALAADRFMPEPLTQSIFNWCQDLKVELENAGMKDRHFLKKRIGFCREFCRRFPDTEVNVILNMRRAEAESFALLGKIEKADSLFAVLVESFPDVVWPYIGWGDIHCKEWFPGPVDYAKAEEIYKKGLAQCKDGKDIEVLHERLEELTGQRKK